MTAGNRHRLNDVYRKHDQATRTCYMDPYEQARNQVGANRATVPPKFQHV